MSKKNTDRNLYLLIGIFVLIAFIVFAFAIHQKRIKSQNNQKHSNNLEEISNSNEQTQKPVAGTFNVIRVIDGDSLILIGADGIKLNIRLRGIDAPELGQPYGMEAKQALSSFVTSKVVSLDTLSKGKYGRYIANVKVGTLLVNKEMIIQGHAWSDQFNTFDKNLYQLELDAKKQKIGLWSMPEPMPPWVWRKNKK